MNKDTFLEKSRNLFGYKYNFINLSDKLISTDYIDIEYEGDIYKQRVCKHLLGKCCEKNTPMKSNEQFIEESIKIWGDTFDYSLTKYSGANKKIKLIYKNNGNIVEQIPTLHLKGHSVKKIDNENFIYQSRLVSNNKYSYDKCDYKNKTTNVILTCPEHGDFYIHPFNHLNYGDCCKQCDEHIVCKTIEKYLIELKLNFEKQKRFKDMELPFDFYIPSMRTCIDFDGEDFKIKNNYCEDNFIDLIKLKYNNVENIGKILKNYKR